MKYILFFICITYNLVSYSISLSDNYYALLAEAEKQIINEKLDSALYYYDLAFEKYGTPFYKHLKQAAIVAKFMGGNNKYLKRCLEKGMNLKELEFFVSNTNYSSLQKNFIEYRQIFIDKIDSTLMKKFIEFDIVDVEVNMLDYQGKHKKHDSIHALMINRYIKLIKDEGFPTENKVGLDRFDNYYSNTRKCNFLTCFVGQITNLADLKMPNTKTFYSSFEDQGVLISEATRPGNKFFWHYGGFPEKDTILIELLMQGIQDLQILPENLVFYYEYSSGKAKKYNRNYKYDMACTYQSIIYTSITRGQAGTYRLPQQVKNKINKQRAEFYIRSLETEEKLFYTLYKLETGKKVTRITNKMIKKIRVINNVFFDYT